MNKREAWQREQMFNTLQQHGIERTDVEALRRISMTLRRWFEGECGDANSCIDEESGKPYVRNSYSGNRYPIADRETGALKRLAKIMAKYPTLGYYVQTDPRGCALYILRPGDVPEGEQAESYYSRGIAVY
jgi:hypothetical protein